MKISVNFDLEQLIDEISYICRDDVIKFICDVDLRFADAGFTESLILKLWTSLKGDLDADEQANLIAEMKK